MFRFPRRSVGSTSLASALASALLLGTPHAALAAPRIFIDPGHGGRYNHAAAYKVSEKMANLAIGLEMQRVLQSRGCTVAMSRTGDTSVELRDVPTWNWSKRAGWSYAKDGKRYGDPPKDDLQGRVRKANDWKADVFISVHNNGGPKSARGSETYAHADDALGRALAGFVQDALVDEVGTRDRGSFTCGFYVVRWANMPAILVECAFVSNPYDAAMLRSPYYRAKMARGIANGVDRFLASNPFKPRYPRVAAEDRYALSAEVARQGWPTGATTVLLANGARAMWPYSMTAVPLSRKLRAPLLFVDGSSVPTVTADALRDLHPSSMLVLGGTAAVTDAQVAEAAKAAGLDSSAVRRIGSDDRYETAVAIAREIGVSDAGTVYLSNGLGYQDALSVSHRAASIGSPILLTEGNKLPAATAAYLKEVANGRRALVKVGVAQGVPAAATPGFRVVKSYYGADGYRTNTAILDGYYRAPTEVKPIVASSKFPSEAILACVHGARKGRPTIFVGDRYLSPYTRLWLLRNASRVTRPTIVGGTEQVPYLMEWEWLKARD